MGDPSADQQTLLVRRVVAIGGLLLLLVLLFFVVRSCASSRKENALKDYNREVSSIVTESDTQVGAPFFELLGRPATSRRRTCRPTSPATACRPRPSSSRPAASTCRGR